jgi:hypothetical protein
MVVDQPFRLFIFEKDADRRGVGRGREGKGGGREWKEGIKDLSTLNFFKLYESPTYQLPNVSREIGLSLPGLFIDKLLFKFQYLVMNQ